MANSFILSNKAVEDLSRIWDYTIEKWSEAQADKYYYMLLGACQDLADGSAGAKQYPEIDSEIFGARVGQHIIFFKRESTNTIHVIRILHSRMDLRNRMGE